MWLFKVRRILLDFHATNGTNVLVLQDPINAILLLFNVAGPHQPTHDKLTDSRLHNITR